MKRMTIAALVLPILAAAETPAPAQRLAHTPLSACAEQLSEDYTNERTANGLDGVVSPDQAAEFSAQCKKSPSVALAKERDAARCVNRYLFWADRQQRALNQAETARIEQRCRAAARATLPANAGLSSAVWAQGSLFTHARTKPLFLALEPRGSSGAAPPVPYGKHQSQSDGSYAYTAIFDSLSATTLLVDLTTHAAILCHDRYRSGAQGSSSSLWYFQDQPMIERSGPCPAELWEFPPETLLDWREHLLKIKPAAVPAQVMERPVAPIAGMSTFSGRCNFTLAGVEHMPSGTCPGAVSLALPPAGQRGLPQVTIKTPNSRAPILVLQLDRAVQSYINNDVITFDASPVSGMPFSWTAYDRLQCSFVKSPSDGWAKSRSSTTPMGTLNCSFEGNPARDYDKLQFGFFVNNAELGAFRAAFVSAHDRLNPGRPFVSPAPDIGAAVPN